MANIEVVNLCNLKCSYCFAKDRIADSSAAVGSHFIPLDEYERRLDFLDRSDIGQVRLIGGEPTLHPKFPELIRRAKQRNKKIAIFSHGLIPERTLQCILSMSPDECTVLVNTSASRFEGGPSPKEREWRLRTIRALGPRAIPGYTIQSTDFDMAFLLPMILEAHCHKLIRVGLAHPTLKGNNKFLHPKEYLFVASKLVRFAEDAAKQGVRLEFDCGFVRCMFSEAEIASLRSVHTDMGWYCSPVLDVNIDGTVLYCFPNSGLTDLDITDSAVANDLRAEMESRVNPYRVAGIYPECSSCMFRINGECSGGGLENTIRRFQHSSFHFRIPGASARMQARPQAHPDHIFQEEDA